MKQKVLAAFRRWVEPALRENGFIGRHGHMLRRQSGVTQIIEIQHSIYGERFTANLGLDLEWLKPTVRWISRPAIGPHAHDCVRWIRIGLCGPEKADRWWSYGPESDGMDPAMKSLALAVAEVGLPWIEAESDPSHFVAHAREQVNRSRSDRHPEGGFFELRLMAAVFAWSGDRDQALRFVDHARGVWGEEKARLEKARSVYRKKHPGGRLVGVPELLDELEELIWPTTDESPFVARAPSSRRQRWRSVRR